MAGLDCSKSYAMFALSCSKDSEDFFTTAPDSRSGRLYPDLFYYLLNNILDDLLFSKYAGTIAILPDNYYAVLVSCANEAELEEVRTVHRRLPEIYADVFSAALVSTDIVFCRDAEQFSESVKQLIRKTSFLQFWGADPQLSETAEDRMSFTNYCRLVRKITNRLGAQEYEGIPEMLEEVLQQATSFASEDVQTSKKRIYAMTSILSAAVDERLGHEREFLDSLRLEERLFSAETIADFRTELKSIISTLIAHQNAAPETDSTGRLMEAVRSYLLANYTQSGINVTSVAEQFGVSVSYLSRSFKERYDVNLLEYLQRLRVNAAKKFLLGNSLKVVAQQVGFWDAQSLIRAFRKCEGLSPAEYRKILERQAAAQQETPEE